jgi:hypothetical protein
MSSFSQAKRLVVAGTILLSCASTAANPFLSGVDRQEIGSQQEMNTLRKELQAIKSDISSLKRQDRARSDNSDLIPMLRGNRDVLNGGGDTPPEAPSVANIFYFDPLNPTAISDEMIPSGYVPFMEVNGRYLLKSNSQSAGFQYLTVSQKAYYERLMPINGEIESPGDTDEEKTVGEEK